MTILWISIHGTAEQLIKRVDDDPDARELIAALLMGRGAEVVCVESAGEALQEIERQRFNVLVSDIGMPLMDGYG